MCRRLLLQGDAYLKGCFFLSLGFSLSLPPVRIPLIDCSCFIFILYSILYFTLRFYLCLAVCLSVCLYFHFCTLPIRDNTIYPTLIALLLLISTSKQLSSTSPTILCLFALPEPSYLLSISGVFLLALFYVDCLRLLTFCSCLTSFFIPDAFISKRLVDQASSSTPARERECQDSVSYLPAGTHTPT